MRFLVDECTGPAVARWLARQGHDAFSVFDELPGVSDEEVIRRAYDERRILITNDKDFGEKVYRQGTRIVALFCFALTTSEVQTRYRCYGICCRSTKIGSPTGSLSLPKSRYASLDRIRNSKRAEEAL